MYYIYIITNELNTTFYIGVTNNLNRRIYEHKYKIVTGFSEKYNLYKLVYMEEYKYVKEALAREKQLKNWQRSWKIDLIRRNNLEFIDLMEDIW